MGFESWIDRQIREAEERGEFDNLPGAGKPLKDLDKPQDADWWVKRLIARENLPPVLPTALALRKEVEDLQETLRPLWRESDVRHVVDDLNQRIIDARRRPSAGPAVFVKTVAVDEAVERWRADRERRLGGGARRSEPADGGQRHDRGRRRWFGRRRS
ncbi:MAG TPA: DUF1992 domain-containing protein [Nocardioidaceae bacterium]|jgi:hypothetical protein